MLAGITLSMPTHAHPKGAFTTPRSAVTILKNLFRKEWIHAEYLLKKPTQMLPISEFACIIPDNAHITNAGYVTLPEEAGSSSKIIVHYAITENRELLILSFETIEEMVCQWESDERPIGIVAARYKIPNTVTIPEVITIHALEKLIQAVNPDVYKTYDLER